jgi:pyruvate/2-oxoglutarate/acetoin dehydrogenase E1 component
VLFFEHKALFASKGEPAPADHVIPFGHAATVREGSDITLVGLAWSMPIVQEAASLLAQEGISAEVIDLRTLVPLDATSVLESVAKTSRILIVEENPYQGGWGGTLASIVADEAFYDLDAPVKRLAAACVPLPFATHLEDQVLPSVASVVASAQALVNG